MEAFSWKKIDHVHLVGIGGIGMSAIAQHFFANGIGVSGSDLHQNKMTKRLEAMGCKISYGHEENNVPVEADLVVTSLAVAASNPEVQATVKRGVKMLKYPEALGEITRDYKTIAVAGSHGKTTTTGMLAKLLIDAGLDPVVILGSTAGFLENNNYRHGRGDILVLEACEYYAGFLNLHADITVIVNVEHDHFDAYPLESDYLEAFEKLAIGTNPEYPVVLNVDFKLGQELLEKIKDRKVLTFGEKDADIILTDYNLELSVPGHHNKINALAVVAVAKILQIDLAIVRKSLKAFVGTARRLELKEERDGCVIYSDYAHHPTEIRASLQALRERYPNKVIGVVYQAHQHHRTKELLGEFGVAFKDADKVIIVPIYAARDSEELMHEITPQKLADVIAAHHRSVSVVDDDDALLLTLVDELVKELDVLVVMGAGDVEKLIG